MKIEDMIMISVDDHLVEPPGMFDDVIPAKYKDRAPRVEHTPEGNDVWVFGDAVIPNVGLNAVAGRPKDEYGVDPTAFDEMRPGCFDVHERVKDMNAGGVLACMNFPSFPAFSGRLFAVQEDKDLALAVTQAYNDWTIDVWTAAYPERFIPMALPVLWDPELCAEEIRRVAKKGCHSMTFTENPAALDQPSFHDPYWDPMFKALVDEGTILNIHLGSSGRLAVTAPDAPMDVMITLQPMNICMAAADLVWSRVFKEFPTLKVALSEGGTGWIPYFLDRLDRTYDMHHLWTGQDFGDQVPSDIFRRHILTCFIADPVGLALRDEIGVDNICWEQDYPHSDSSWPNAPEELHEMVEKYAVPDDDLNKITYENAMKWYRFDPFAIRPKEQCTVGALRAEAAGHDVSVRSMSERHKERNTVSLAEMAARRDRVTGPRDQRRRRARELGREQILDAAEEVFARKGFHDATVKEIAAAAEFSVGGVYSFFPEKDDLFVQLFLRRGSEFMDGMRAVLAESGSPRGRLHDLADYQVGFFREHANFGKLFLRTSGVVLGDLDSKVDRTALENTTEAMNLQAKLFRDGQDAGELRDGDPEVLAKLFSGIVSAYQAADPLVVGANGGPTPTVAGERMPVDQLHEILDGAFSA